MYIQHSSLPSAYFRFHILLNCHSYPSSSPNSSKQDVGMIKILKNRAEEKISIVSVSWQLLNFQWSVSTISQTNDIEGFLAWGRKCWWLVVDGKHIHSYLPRERWVCLKNELTVRCMPLHPSLRGEIFYPFISCIGKRRGLVLTH